MEMEKLRKNIIHVMQKRVFIIILFIVATLHSFAANDALSAWQAGEKVTYKTVVDYGIDKCFMATAIPDNVFARMKGKTYKKNCTVRRADLRYVRVLHYNLQGEICIGELVCDKGISGDLVDIFRKLFNAKYPIERMVLIDNYGADDKCSMEANNTSCFNYRFVAGSKVLSNHSRGRAVDINPLYNPCVAKRRNGTVSVDPEKGRRYADRSKSFSYKIEKGDLCYRLFIEHGFMWGGNWRSKKDYQHFEKK